MDYRTRPVVAVSRRRTSGMRRRLLLFLVCCVLAGLLWIGFCLYQIGSVDRNPAVNRYDQKPADAGIVLGASMWGDTPSPGLQERLNQALADYRAGKFEKLILTGGLDKPDYKYTEAEGMANFLISHGIPEEALLLENESTSTYENLLFSREIMEDHGLKSSVIITHTYHGNRAYEIAEMLNYDHPGLSLTETKVLKPNQTVLREVLAYTKWKMDQIRLVLGWK
ncbi:YdcF family protein [Paenibacillus brevis]|uniref:YdcF family protein n=1 Tax=Paenibacillus brevis TaxID=2841508 RepID=A0ABS6FQM0_9BACL|nr:YdcF family protein [Paenibacillus brevis]MBU5672471.1 YdcF family protein [Paenibacillus brevis]